MDALLNLQTPHAANGDLNTAVSQHTKLLHVTGEPGPNPNSHSTFHDSYGTFRASGTRSNSRYVHPTPQLCPGFREKHEKKPFGNKRLFDRKPHTTNAKPRSLSHQTVHLHHNTGTTPPLARTPHKTT
ncbi:unnamed protein product [Ectocarpus sp. 6 AP-2014]